MGRDFPRTVLRLEGFAGSVAHRLGRLQALLAEFDPRHVLERDDSRRLWRAIRDLEFLAEPRERAIWRVGVKPSQGAQLLAQIGAIALASQLDWGGGLVWIASEPTEAAAIAIRTATHALRGHATLMRADASFRGRAEVFEPPAPWLLAQTQKLKASLDPHGVFNAGRMYAKL